MKEIKVFSIDETIAYNMGYAKGCEDSRNNVETLTDEEQRIFLAAMGREERVCKNIEDLWVQLSLTSEDDVDLMKVCKEVKRKVMKALWTKMGEISVVGEKGGGENEESGD